MALPQPTPHLTPSELDNFIDDHGVSVDVELATLCPCSLARTGQPLAMCRLCDGNGAIYNTPVRVKALLTSREYRKNFIEVGSWETGSCSATFKSGVLVPDGSRVTPVFDRTVINDEILTRGAATPKAKSLERVRFPEILTLDRVIDQDGVDYIPGTDVVVSNLHYLTWPTSTKPAEGKRYVVRYVTRPTYQVMANQPRTRRENETNVPTYVRLLRIDRVGRQQERDAA
ncbi:MAG: hypothetical protein HY816_20010 [Candidatus Wallbacteria bacterium]|nr:hypothetical protein [Candidatus Wallbacteria bacterium]